MVGLVDIAPATTTVAGVEVFGVSARGIAYLLNRFPQLRMLMAGGEVSAEDLITMAPDAVSAIIAAGTGTPGVTAAEEAADRLSLDMQADFLTAILRLTMPKGVSPFVEKLTTLGNTLGVNTDVKAQDTTLPLQSDS